MLRCALLAGATTTLLISAAAAATAAVAPPTRPHVLLMLVDDMGYNDVEFHNGGAGPGWTKTPNMNRLAAQGTRLDHHCTNSRRLARAWHWLLPRTTESWPTGYHLTP
jgi:hypothetical protein